MYGDYFLCVEATAYEQADSDSGIEVAARDVTDRISHRQNGQSKSQGDANETDA